MNCRFRSVRSRERERKKERKREKEREASSVMGGGSSKSSSKRTPSNVSTSSRLSSRSTPQHANVVKLDGQSLFQLVCDEKEFKPLCKALYQKYGRYSLTHTHECICVYVCEFPILTDIYIYMCVCVYASSSESESLSLCCADVKSMMMGQRSIERSI